MTIRTTLLTTAVTFALAILVASAPATESRAAEPDDPQSGSGPPATLETAPFSQGHLKGLPRGFPCQGRG